MSEGSAGQIAQCGFARASLRLAPAGAEEDADLLHRGHDTPAMELLVSGGREVSRYDLYLAAIVIEDKIRFFRTVSRPRWLLRGRGVGQQRGQRYHKQQESLHRLSPYCVTFRLTSSSTNDVCSEESSTPLKKIWIVCPLNEVKLNVFCLYPAAALRLEYVASVESTVPEELRTCTVSVSKAVLVVVSSVSMCNQRVSVAAVAAEGMATCCSAVSVCVVP